MNMKMKPYNEYKETEYEWFGKVPNHWTEMPIKSISTVISSRYKDVEDKLELLSVYRDYGVIKRDSRDDNHNVISADLSNYKCVDVGDLVLNKMKVWQGSLGISRYKGIVSPAYIVCKLNRDLNSKYINYLLRNKLYVTIYNQLSYGVRVDQWDMRYNDFKNIKMYLPSKKEQDNIVSFLDNKLKKIDRFIDLKTRQIELLQEQKETMINKVVTKGLDDNMKMKDSGIDWIGEIPEDWEVIKFKRVLIENSSGYWGNEPKDNEFDIKVLRSTEQDKYGFWRINEDKIATRNIKTIKEKDLLKKNDLLITKSSGSMDHIGKVTIADEEIENLNATYSNFTQKLVIKRELSSKYYWYLLNSNLIKEQYKIISTTTTGLSNLNMYTINNMNVTYLPKETMEDIVSFLDEESKKVDKTIGLYQKEIDLIKEYRTSLISSVVTGKIDIREFEEV